MTAASDEDPSATNGDCGCKVVYCCCCSCCTGVVPFFCGGGGGGVCGRGNRNSVPFFGGGTMVKKTKNNS